MEAAPSSLVDGGHIKQGAEMKVTLAYGRNDLEVNLPDSAQVITPNDIPSVPNEAEALRQAMRQPTDSLPLGDLIEPDDTVIIVHTDITRATPNDRMLPVIIEELHAAGVKREKIKLMNGLGTHRKQTDAELRMMLGDHIVDNYTCLQHDCFENDNLVPLGATSFGNPVRINRHYMEADKRILTGFIEPHFFAGFSGGPKALLPALAGHESVFSNHGYAMIANPKATWGITQGNTLWEEMREVALMTNPTFLVNVTLNSDKRITGVFAGDMLAAHAEGCAFVKQNAMAGVEQRFDIVITTNSGYPLDQNLYQAVKGMSAASEIVKEGGSIIIAAACEDGLPDHGGYAKLLKQAGSPQGIVDMVSQPGFHEHDQWQVQIQARIQLFADVYVYSHHLSDGQIRGALFEPCRDIPELVRELRAKYGTDASICVLPEGPQTIPYLRQV